LPTLTDGFAQPALRELDLRRACITNVIWATGYDFDFSMIKLPTLDEDGYPIQTRGVTAYPGLFFVGLPWLHDAKSGLIYGVGEDASFIADRIAERCDRRDDLLSDEDAPLQPNSPRVEALTSTPGARHLGKTILTMSRVAIAAAAFLLSRPSAQAEEAVNVPAPPHVNFLATPASELYLGMQNCLQY